MDYDFQIRKKQTRSFWPDVLMVRILYYRVTVWMIFLRR